MESERPEEKLYSCTSRLLHGFILVGRQGKGEANEDILPSFARISHLTLVTCEHCKVWGQDCDPTLNRQCLLPLDNFLNEPLLIVHVHMCILHSYSVIVPTLLPPPQ